MGRARDVALLVVDKRSMGYAGTRQRSPATRRNPAVPVVIRNEQMDLGRRGPAQPAARGWPGTNQG